MSLLGQTRLSGRQARRLRFGSIVVAGILSAAVNAATETRVTAYDYDAQGRLVKEVLEPNSNEMVCLTTESGYDGRGNLSSQTIRACGFAEGVTAPTGIYAFSTRTSTITFGDTYQRFPTRLQNPAGHVETRTYDTRSGQITRSVVGLLATDSGQVGQATTAIYDYFGRNTYIYKPDAASVYLSYEPCSNGACSEAALAAGAVYRTVRTETNAPGNWVYFDAMHRQVLTELQGHSGTGNPPLIYTHRTYDTLGRLRWDTKPYYEGDTQWVLGVGANYDILGRPLQELAPDGKTYTYTYNALQVKQLLQAGSRSQTTWKYKNSQGWVVKITDALGESLLQDYTPFGLLSKTTDAVGNSNFVHYDNRGRKTSLSDKDLGSVYYQYNAIGDLVSQSYQGFYTYNVYDTLSRLIKRTEAELVSEWAYDRNLDGTRCQYGTGKLCQSRSDNGYVNTQTYDTAGRPSSATTQIGSQRFTVKTTYVVNSSLPKRKTYPSGLVVLNSYTDQGYLKQVRNDADTTDIYWSLPVRDAEGHFKRESYGNGIVTNRAYDERSSLVDRVTAGTNNAVLDLVYNWDVPTGNLELRQDNTQSLIESLSYDGLNRLTQSTVNASAVSPAVNTLYAYDRIGNMICKSDLGACSASSPNYKYGAYVAEILSLEDNVVDERTLAHAVYAITGTVNGVVNPTFSYDMRGNMISGAGRTYTYTSFNMPQSISKSGFSTEFTYGPDHQRVRQVSTGGGVTRTQLYLHPDQANGMLYEQETFNGTVSQHHYITAHGVVIAKFTLENGVWTRLYMHHDQLGSVVAITDAAGTVIERMAYDAWGKRRFPGGQADPSSTIHADPTVRYNTDRGYTNHEMLDELALIHMNGRVYDPTIARFVTPDPTVPNPEWLQDYNRYSYVTNNPFAFTDPTGFNEESGNSENVQDSSGQNVSCACTMGSVFTAKGEDSFKEGLKNGTRSADPIFSLTMAALERASERSQGQLLSDSQAYWNGQGIGQPYFSADLDDDRGRFGHGYFVEAGRGGVVRGQNNPFGPPGSVTQGVRSIGQSRELKAELEAIRAGRPTRIEGTKNWAHPSQRSAARAAARDAGMGKHGQRESKDVPYKTGSQAPEPGPRGDRTETRSLDTGRTMAHDEYGHNKDGVLQSPHYNAVDAKGDNVHHFYSSPHNPLFNR